MHIPFKIGYLDDHRHLLGEMATRFVAAWPGYYGAGGKGDVRADIHSFCSHDHLPIGLVAVAPDDVTYLGSATLRKRTESHFQLGPWLTALLVVPEARHQSIGSRLIHATEVLAARLGYQTLYARSATAVALFKRHCWTPIDEIDQEGEHLIVFKKKVESLANNDPGAV